LILNDRARVVALGSRVSARFISPGWAGTFKPDSSLGLGELEPSFVYERAAEEFEVQSSAINLEDLAKGTDSDLSESLTQGWRLESDLSWQYDFPAPKSYAKLFV
jgi:hypothetical protein